MLQYQMSKRRWYTISKRRELVDTFFEKENITNFVQRNLIVLF